MRTVYTLVLALVFVSLANASAQAPPRLIGVGVSVNPVSLLVSFDEVNLTLPSSFTNIHVAITPVASFRIEPEVGIFATSLTTTDDAPRGITEHNTSSIRFGAGLFYRMPLGESFSTYVGPRVGMIITNDDRTIASPSVGTESRSTTQSDVYVGASLGGEFLLSPHFGFGAEVQLNYLSLGEATTTFTPPVDLPADNSVTSRSIVTTNAMVFARFYF